MPSEPAYTDAERVAPKPKRNNGRTGSIHVRLDPDVKAQVEAEAEARGLTVNWLVARAVEDYLPRLIPADQFSLTRPEPRPLHEPSRAGGTMAEPPEGGTR